MICKRSFVAITSIIGAGLLLGACSHEQLYDGIRVNRLNDCMTLSGTRHEECISRYEMSYQEYRRLRDLEIDDSTRP
jgi:hypothetical protein